MRTKTQNNRCPLWNSNQLGSLKEQQTCQHKQISGETILDSPDSSLVILRHCMFVFYIKIASLVQNLLQFCWIGGFCLFGELHRKGFAIAGPTSSIFLINIFTGCAQNPRHATTPIGQIHPFSKIAVTFKPMMIFSYPLRLRMPYTYTSSSILWLGAPFQTIRAWRRRKHRFPNVLLT